MWLGQKKTHFPEELYAAFYSWGESDSSWVRVVDKQWRQKNSLIRPYPLNNYTHEINISKTETEIHFNHRNRETPFEEWCPNLFTISQRTRNADRPKLSPNQRSFHLASSLRPAVQQSFHLASSLRPSVQQSFHLASSLRPFVHRLMLPIGEFLSPSQHVLAANHESSHWDFWSNQRRAMFVPVIRPPSQLEFSLRPFFCSADPACCPQSVSSREKDDMIGFSELCRLHFERGEVKQTWSLSARMFDISPRGPPPWTVQTYKMKDRGKRTKSVDAYFAFWKTHPQLTMEWMQVKLGRNIYIIYKERHKEISVRRMELCQFVRHHAHEH